MALADLALDHRILECLRGGESSEHVRDRRTRLTKSLGELLLREVVGLHHELVRTRRLDRVQVGPLQILDQRKLEAVPHLVANDRRYRGSPGEPGREDAAVSGHQLISITVGRYHYWLQDAVARDGCGEFGEALGVERRPRLMSVRPDEFEGNLVRGWTLGRLRCCGSDWLPQEHVETATESTPCHQAIAPPRAIGARARRRAETSRARSSYACAAAERRSYREIGRPWLGASARRTARGIRASATRLGKCRLTSSMTWRDSRFRRSSMVNTMAKTSSWLFRRARTASMVESSWARPSSA